MRAGALSVIVAALAAGGCAAPAEAPPAIPAEAVVQAPAAAQPPGPGAPRAKFPALRNPGFELDEDPRSARRRAGCAPGWMCSAHNDPNAFRFFADVTDGRRSFCVEPVRKEPWALATQASVEKSLRGMRLRFSVEVRLTDVAGAGAGPWAQVQRADAPRETHHKLLKGSTQWESHAIEFDVPHNAQTVAVGVTLRGTGRACFDNAHLEILRPAKNPV